MFDYTTKHRFCLPVLEDSKSGEPAVIGNVMQTGSADFDSGSIRGKSDSMDVFCTYCIPAETLLAAKAVVPSTRPKRLVWVTFCQTRVAQLNDRVRQAVDTQRTLGIAAMSDSNAR